MPDLPHEKGSRANKAPPLCCIRQSIFSMRDRFSDAAPLLRVTYENRRGRETSRQREWSGSRATRKIPQAHAAPCVAALTGCRIGSVDVRGSFSALSRDRESVG